jgi:1-acyl-sn-glycerol-3-phosphate acyltransferase
MIRLIFAVISLILFFIFCVILTPIEWIIGMISPKAQETSRLAIVQGYVKLLLWICGVKVTLIGRERIPTDTASLFTPNHRSMFDILVMLAYAPSTPAFISKKEWKKIPLLSWWIDWMHGFYLDRENLREGLKVVLAAAEAMKGGQSVVIFPEGTRNRGSDERELLPFHEGSFEIATKSGCPIIPVAINHTSEIFEDQFPKVRAGRVVLEYGTPIETKDMTREDRKFLGKRVREIITEMVTRNHEL